MDKSSDKIFINLGLTPGAQYKFYSQETIKIDGSQQKEVVKLSSTSIVLDSKYKNYFNLAESIRRAESVALDKIYDTTVKNIKDGAFQQAVILGSLFLAETVKAVSDSYPMDGQSIELFATMAEKASRNLEAAINASYDKYMNESQGIQLEKASREQTMNAESIARASEVKSATTTSTTKGGFYGRLYTRPYGATSIGYGHGIGRAKTTSTTTYTTGMHQLTNDLKANATAISNMEIYEQSFADNSAIESIMDRCRESFNSFIKSFEDAVISAHEDLLARPNEEYDSLSYWTKVIKTSSEKDIDKINSCIAYYGLSPRDIWEELLANEIFDYLLEHRFRGTYSGKYLDYYKKALGLGKFVPYASLSEILTTYLTEDYRNSLKASKYDAGTATHLAELQDIASNCIYITESDKHKLSEIMSGANKAINKQRLNSVNNLLHWAIIFFGFGISAFLAIMCIVALINSNDKDFDIGWGYLGVVALCCTIAGATIDHKSGIYGITMSLIRGLRFGALGAAILLVAIIITGVATGRLEW